MLNYYDTIIDGINDLFRDLHDKLSRDYVILDVQYGKKKFNFHKPLNVQEESNQCLQRHKFISLIVREALVSYIKSGSREFAFKRITDLMAMIPDVEQIQSPIAPESYEEIKIEAKKAIDLNYDAYQVKMQDPLLNKDFYPVGLGVITNNCGCGIRDKVPCC